MAEKACHGFGSTTQVGLTQVLGMGISAQANFALLALVILNCATSLVVMRSRLYNRLNKALQLLLVWFVPLFGAVICLIMVRPDRFKPKPYKPPEFFDNEKF